MENDDLTPEQERQMAAKLLMGTKGRNTHVETRRSGRVSPERDELRVVNFVDPANQEWVYCEVRQRTSTGWIKLEEYHDQKAAQRSVDKYARSGDRVTAVNVPFK